MDEREQIVGGFGRGMLLLVIANALYIASAYGITTFVARILEPSDFGVYGIITGWVSILTALLVRGLTAGISREMVSGAVTPATAWQAGVALGVRTSMLFAGIGIVLAPVIALITDVDEHTVLLAVCSLAAVSFGANAVLLAWPLGMHDYARQAWAQIAYALVRAAFVVGGAALWGVPGAAVGYVAAPALASLALVMRHPAATEDIAPVMRRMAREFLPVGIVSITVTAFFIVDVFAMSAAGAPRVDVGVYVAYAALAHVPFYLLQAASSTMVPAIAAASDVGERVRAIRRTLTDTVVLLAGPTLLLAVGGDAGARIIFGSQYHADQPVVAPLAVATAGIALSAGLVAIAVALKRLRWPMLITTLGGVALAAACALAAMASDANVATHVALATCGVCVLTALALGIDVWRVHGAVLDARRALGGTTVAVGVSIAPLFMESDGSRVASIFAGGLMWLVLILRLGLIDVRRASPSLHSNPDS